MFNETIIIDGAVTPAVVRESDGLVLVSEDAPVRRGSEIDCRRGRYRAADITVKADGIKEVRIRRQ